MQIAIVTGASSGLGMEFAHAIIERYHELDEVWLIARRKERLELFADRHTNTTIRSLRLDLSKPESYDQLTGLLAEENPQIQILINNAGFEMQLRFDETSMTDIGSMIDLNVKGLTLLNAVCLPYMGKGSFEIVTCSVTSFAPTPGLAVYSATKAYASFFIKALRRELKPRQIKVLLLCPGNMDTEMNIRSNVKEKHSKIAKLPYLNLNKETRKALKKAEHGQGVYTPKLFYKGYRLLGKLLPSSLMMYLTNVERRKKV